MGKREGGGEGPVILAGVEVEVESDDVVRARAGDLVRGPQGGLAARRAVGRFCGIVCSVSGR